MDELKIRKPRIKKTCNNCRALSDAVDSIYHYDCALGYKIDTYNCIPKEPCTKPITYAAYLKALEDNKIKRQRGSTDSTGRI